MCAAIAPSAAATSSIASSAARRVLLSCRDPAAGPGCNGRAGDSPTSSDPHPLHQTGSQQRDSRPPVPDHHDDASFVRILQVPCRLSAAGWATATIPVLDALAVPGTLADSGYEKATGRFIASGPTSGQRLASQEATT